MTVVSDKAMSRLSILGPTYLSGELSYWRHEKRLELGKLVAFLGYVNLHVISANPAAVVGPRKT